MTSNRGKRRAEARARARRRRNTVFATLGVIGFVGASVLLFAALRRDPSPAEGDGESDDPSADVADRPEVADARDGSEPVEGPSAFRIDPIDEYRLVYRVDDYAGGTQVTTTEDLRVRRPFDARVDRKQGPPPGDTLTSTQIARFGVLSLPAGDGTLTVEVPPEPASADLRFDIALEALVDDDRAARREWREVAGLRCRVHRFGEPITTGEPVDWDGDADNYADLCIDERGVLLEELWVTDGRVLRRRLAVEVGEQAFVDDDLLQITSDPLPQDQGGGSLIELDPTSSPTGSSWALDEPPAGFERRGRYGADAPRQGAQPTVAGSTLVDVFTRGRDVVLLEQGTVPPATSADGARNVDAGALGQAKLVLGLRLNEVRVEPATGQFVRVRGTLPADDLVVIARSVRRIEGGTGLRPAE